MKINENIKASDSCKIQVHPNSKILIGTKLYKFNRRRLVKCLIGLNAHSLHKHVDAVDIQIQQLRDAELGVNSFGHCRRFRDPADIQFFSDFTHHNRITQI